jgi:hypothetical protein
LGLLISSYSSSIKEIFIKTFFRIYTEFDIDKCGIDNSKKMFQPVHSNMSIDDAINCGKMTEYIVPTENVLIAFGIFFVLLYFLFRTRSNKAIL